jgi:hypothetical protein
MQTEGGRNYLCRRGDTWEGFSVHPYRDAELSQSAVTAEVRRTSFNPTGPPVRGLSVESSTWPVKGSFKYTYALLGKSGADAIAIGYVTPSGWVVSGLFTTPTEPEAFREFLSTYRMPEASAR